MSNKTTNKYIKVMKAIIILIGKVFKTQKQTVQKTKEVDVEMTEEQFDAWIVSIRQKPQFNPYPMGCTIKKKQMKQIVNRTQSSKNDGLEEAGCLVLA